MRRRCPARSVTGTLTPQSRADRDGVRGRFDDVPDTAFFAAAVKSGDLPFRDGHAGTEEADPAAAIDAGFRLLDQGWREAEIRATRPAILDE